MTNEEMQNIIEFMIRRQEVFSTNMERLEANQGRLQANQERLQANLEGLQAEMRGLAAIVGRIGEAQIETHNDVSNLAKIVNGLVQLVVKERNGDEQAQ